MAATSADCSKEQEENHALPYTIPLYNDTGDHAHPALTIHYPTNLSSDTRYAALLCCRGGSHATCLGSGEGTAEWAADNGMVGVEVEYRTSLADGGSGFEVDREPAFFPANGFPPCRHPPCRGLCFATRLSAWRRGRGPTRRGRPSTSWGNLES